MFFAWWALSSFLYLDQGKQIWKSHQPFNKEQNACTWAFLLFLADLLREGAKSLSSPSDIVQKLSTATDCQYTRHLRQCQGVISRQSLTAPASNSMSKTFPRRNMLIFVQSAVVISRDVIVFFYSVAWKLSFTLLYNATSLLKAAHRIHSFSLIRVI